MAPAMAHKRPVSVQCAAIIVVVLVSAVHVACNLSNLEEINELKLVRKWVRYLCEHQIKGPDGKLLQDNYFVDNSGVSHSSELSQGGDETFEKLKQMVGWGRRQDDSINTTSLRYEPNSATDGRYSARVWARIAKDMMWTIDSATLEGNGSEFLSAFKSCVLNPWQDVIYTRYNSILRLDRQDAIHLAVLKAHQDYFTLVCQRMRERLAPDLGRFLPQLVHWQDPHEKVRSDHIKWELKALGKYRDLRKSLERELKPGELDLVIEVLPIPIQDVVYGVEVDPQMVRLEEEMGDEQEINVKYLIKLDERNRIKDENGSELDVGNNSQELRRFVWRAIHRGLWLLGRHVVEAVEPDDIRRTSQSNLDALRVILTSLREAVVQRVNALNGMMDNKLNRELVMNFQLQRDNLNELFDRISDDLSTERRPIWLELLSRLNLVREHGDGTSNKFRLNIERESLRRDAEELFTRAMEQLARGRPELRQATKILDRIMLEAIDCYTGDAIKRNLVDGFNGLKGECAKLQTPLNETAPNHEGTDQSDGHSHGELTLDEVREAKRQARAHLRDFVTFLSAYAIRANDRWLPVLVADVIDYSRGLLRDCAGTREDYA